MRQADAAGNVGRSAARHFEVDTTKPNLTLGVASPTNAVVFSGTAGTVTGAAAGESADGTSVAIRVYEGTDLVATLAADASTGTYTESWTAPHDGTYTAEAEQADAAGNMKVTAPRVTVLVDTQAPAVTVAAPAAAVKGPRPVVSGTAGEHAADDDVVHVAIKQGTTVVDAYDAPVSSGAYSKATTVDLADGDYTAEVTQQDAAGNVSAVASRSFTVDHIAPTVTVTTPATLVTAARPSIGGTAGTAASDLGTVSVTLTRNGSQVGGVLSGTVAGGGSWSVTPASDLASGTYTAEAVQSDQAGNVSTTAARVFKVDRSAPALTLDVTSPTKLRRPAFSGTRGMAADAEDNSADLAAVTGRVLDGTTEVATFTGSGTGASWSGTPDADLADGTYTVEVVQSDTAGNTTTQTAPLTVDAHGSVAHAERAGRGDRRHDARRHRHRRDARGRRGHGHDRHPRRDAVHRRGEPGHGRVQRHRAGDAGRRLAHGDRHADRRRRQRDGVAADVPRRHRGPGRHRDAARVAGEELTRRRSRAPRATPPATTPRSR